MSPLLLLGWSVLLTAALVDSIPPPFVARLPCGLSGRTCIQGEANCVGNKKCVCDKANGFVKGRADFRCYPKNTPHCEFKGDPTLITYNKEIADFPFPCRYLASHVRADIRDKDDLVAGKCEVKVYGFNSRAKGKVFVEGFDVTIKLNFGNYGSQLSFRHMATTKDNVNTAVKFGNYGVWEQFDSGDGNFHYNNVVTGTELFFTWDDQNNRFIYTLQGCGIKVMHVPYDLQQMASQRQVPGLSISLTNEHNPTYLSEDKAMCLAPNQDLKSIKDGNLDAKESVLLRAFMADTTQNRAGSNANSQCAAASSTLSTCIPGRRRKAIQNCYWMLKDVQFNKCYDKDPSGQNIMDLFEGCVTAWCTNKRCPEVIEKIQNSGCATIGKVSELAPFLAGSMCPNNNSNNPIK